MAIFESDFCNTHFVLAGMRFYFPVCKKTNSKIFDHDLLSSPHLRALFCLTNEALMSILWRKKLRLWKEVEKSAIIPANLGAIFRPTYIIVSWKAFHYLWQAVFTSIYQKPNCENWEISTMGPRLSKKVLSSAQCTKLDLWIVWGCLFRFLLPLNDPRLLARHTVHLATMGRRASSRNRNATLGEWTFSYEATKINIVGTTRSRLRYCRLEL